MKKNFSKIFEFLDAVADETSNLNPIYVRNFRAVLNIIPFIGPVIDANTIGAVEDHALNQKLSHLEGMCESALRADDLDLLKKEITMINSVFFNIVISYQEYIFRDNQEIKSLLYAYLVTPAKILKDGRPDPKFCLVTISGASATGKDCLVDLLYNDFFPNHSRCELLTKVTTREQRLTDSRYYKFLSIEEFQNYLESDRIIFPYSKREFQYGFDKLHFSNCLDSDTLLFCIFTDFKKLPMAKQFLRAQGINVISILIEAPKNHLKHRSEIRILSKADFNSRWRSIKQDLLYIKNNQKVIEDMFEYIIYNGDDRAKCDTYYELRNIVREL